MARARKEYEWFLKTWEEAESGEVIAIKFSEAEDGTITPRSVPEEIYKLDKTHPTRVAIVFSHIRTSRPKKSKVAVRRIKQNVDNQ